MKKQTWKAMNADGQVMEVFFCDTLEQAGEKLQHTFGDNKCFLRLEKGIERDIEESKKIYAWNASRFSLALIAENLQRIVMKHKPSGEWKFYMDNTPYQASCLIKGGNVSSNDGTEYWPCENMDIFMDRMSIKHN